MAKIATKIADISIFGHFKAPYRHQRGKVIPYSCRGGPELQFKGCYIKIGQELASEMREM